MIYAGFSPRASNVHHPFMGRLIIFLSLVRGNVPGKANKQYKHLRWIEVLWQRSGRKNLGKVKCLRVPCPCTPLYSILTVHILQRELQKKKRATPQLTPYFQYFSSIPVHNCHMKFIRLKPCFLIRKA